MKWLPPLAAIGGICFTYHTYMSSPFASDGALYLTVMGIISGLGGYTAWEFIKWIRFQRPKE